MGDISEQLALKERMNCKSFDWFMKEIAYDVFDKYPPLPPNQHWGELKNDALGLCFDTFGRHPPESVGASMCHGYGGNQLIRLNTKGQMTSGEWCLHAEGKDKIVVAWCKAGSVDGNWQYDEESRHMKHTRLNKCLGIHPENQQLILRDCNENNTYFKWTWKTLTPHWMKKRI